jgi:hypothetical protein
VPNPPLIAWVYDKADDVAERVKHFGAYDFVMPIRRSIARRIDIAAYLFFIWRHCAKEEVEPSDLDWDLVPDDEETED